MPTPAVPSTPADAGARPGAAPGRAAARLARVVENALSDAGVSLPQYRMLIFLAEGGDAAASRLAGTLGVSRPSITALVDGLVARGLVERLPDARDRRRVSHSLTDAGLAALEGADRAVEERLVELLADVSSGRERATAVEGLRIWEQALNVGRDQKLATS